MTRSDGRFGTPEEAKGLDVAAVRHADLTFAASVLRIAAPTQYTRDVADRLDAWATESRPTSAPGAESKTVSLPSVEPDLEIGAGITEDDIDRGLVEARRLLVDHPRRLPWAAISMVIERRKPIATPATEAENVSRIEVVLGKEVARQAEFGLSPSLLDFAWALWRSFEVEGALPKPLTPLQHAALADVLKFIEEATDYMGETHQQPGENEDDESVQARANLAILRALIERCPPVYRA